MTLMAETGHIYLPLRVRQYFSNVSIFPKFVLNLVFLVRNDTLALDIIDS